MKKQIIFLLTIAVFVLCGSAAAHPLGNFSINQFARISIEKSQVKLHSVLDLAEIPTFQQSQSIDINKDGTLSPDELDAYAESITPAYVSNLALKVNGQTVALRPNYKEIKLKSGAGNLQTLLIKWDLLGDLSGVKSADANSVEFLNNNYEGRIGWNEIVVESVGDINIYDSTAYGSGLTNELEAYPSGVLSEMLDERQAKFSFTSAPLAAGVQPLKNRDGHIAAPVEKDRFAELIAVPEITPSIILFGLLIAFGFGALHALSPGHGKTVVGAYLVGSRGTVKHAVFLGMTVTITHTISVFALGVIALFASEYIFPEKLMPFLSFVSGLLVFFIGISLFKNRLFAAFGWTANNQYAHAHHPHSHDHDHDHEHHSHSHDGHHHHHEHEHSGHHHHHDGLTHTHGGSTHTHLPPEEISWRSLLGLGISGGLLPCPSALVLMLSAISLNRIGYGLVLTLVFSFGLAATLTGVGLAFLFVGKFFDSPKLSGNRIIKALPVFSAFVISCVGAVICYNSLF